MKFILTNSQDATTSYYIERTLTNSDIKRIDTDKFNQVSYGYMDENNTTDLIWNRRPFEHTENSNQIIQSENVESFYNEWGLFGWKNWINPPHINWTGSKKLIGLRLAAQCGLSTPKWLVTNRVQHAKNFIKELKNQVVIKPINHGYFKNSDNINLIYTNKLGSNYDISLVKNCPTLIQEEIKKNYDARIIYLNGFTICILLKSHLYNIDIRINEMKDVYYDIITPPDKITEQFIRLMNTLQLRYSASDFVIDKSGKWYFLENNPNGQWAWMDQPLNGALVNFFDSYLTKKQI